ncbi:MAG: glycosyltransferase family 4 protein [Bacteroidetes bacterium]|nr:glycosyltransferase family 4 protein [Bacteroidota bacterium]MCL2301930.1 glycosyltransferase family 4 protein [Lentimicrobiaceae bacterium]
MKILLITTSSGDTFYCSNCFRDNLYAQALRNAGHDVIIMPLYLPLTDTSFLADTPLFFPATSYYVAQKFFKKGKMPHFLEKILDSPSLLRMASSLSGTTSAKGMEQMTLSMINGDDKNFAKQAEKIIYWIKNHDRPDVIHLSTSMLAGIAKAIKNHTNIPVVCSVQDEEIWLDSLESQYACEAWQAIRLNSTYVDRFVASSEFYKAVALSKIPEIKEIDVVYPGVNIEKYNSSNYPKEPTIGFYYRMNYENGLDILTQSFIQLKKENIIPNLKLKIGGGYTRENKKFVHRIQTILRPYMNDVIWSEHYSLDEHTTFYKDISLICAPLRFNEAFGLYISEAFAAGRPAVVPNAGSFSEIIENAGLLYAPNNSEQLTEALRKILTNPVFYDNCKGNALRLSHERYSDVTAAEKLLRIYSQLVG